MARPRENEISLSEHLNGKVADTNCLAFVRRRKDLRMSHGLLYMETHTPGMDEKIFAFVVPAKKRQAAIDGCHRDAGHQGRDRTLSLMKERFWWPGMAVQVVGAVKGCLRCKQFEALPAIADLMTIESTELLDLVHIDIVNMETTVATKDTPVVKKVLVVVDHFMRYVRAFVIPDRMAKTIAKTLYEDYFSVFRFPSRLMSDRAPEFVGGTLTALCDILHVKKLCTSPYHPQSNGAMERTHQTLMRMIGKLDPNRKHRWPDHIGSICHAYNTTRSQVTGYSPHFLMFGCRPRLPIDLLFLTAQRAAIKGVDSLCYCSLRPPTPSHREGESHG